MGNNFKSRLTSTFLIDNFSEVNRIPGHFSGKVLPWLSLNIECEF